MPENKEIAMAPGSQWQRLSPWSVGFILFARIFRFVRENIPLLLGAGVGAAAFERIGPLEIVLAGSTLLLLATIVSLIHYRRFRFRLDGDVLFVRRGLIEREELKLRAERIQHLSIQQPLYMRPFGLVRFSADTPGSGTAEVELPGIRRETAKILRARLGQDGDTTDRADGADTPDAESRGTAELFRITPSNLTLHGVASNYAYVVAAALSPFLHRIESFLAEHIGELHFWETFSGTVGSPFLAAILLLSGLVLLMVMFSVVVAWLRFYGFLLTRENGRFRQYSGLFNRQEQVLSLAKLQSVEWTQTAVGRLVRRSHLVCRQIGVAAPGESGGRTFLVPGLDAKTAKRLAREFWPDIDPAHPLQRVHRYYVRALLLRLGLVFGALFALLAAVSLEPAWLLGIPAAPAILWPFVFQHWRVLGWATDRRFIYLRRGLIGRRVVMFPSQNVQRADLSQSWFQKRHGVATIQLSLPSGPVTLPFLPEADARFLVNLTLYRLEVSDLRETAQANGNTSPSRV